MINTKRRVCDEVGCSRAAMTAVVGRQSKRHCRQHSSVTSQTTVEHAPIEVTREKNLTLPIWKQDFDSGIKGTALILDDEIRKHLSLFFGGILVDHPVIPWWY